MDTVNIALCFNNNFCQIAAGAVQSIICHTSQKFQYDIYIIHNDITDQNQNLISKINNKDNVAVKFVNFDVQFGFSNSLYVHTRFTPDIYTRIYLHKIFPNLNKILYTDVDIIVNSDIADLYNTKMQGLPIAAVLHRFVRDGDVTKLKTATWIQNSAEQFRKYENIYKYNVEYLNFTDEDMKTYFNSGTILFDLKKSGKIIDEKLPELVKNEYLLPDLDILNTIFKGNVKVLDGEYCVLPEELFSFVNKHGRLPAIIHYCGAGKPNKFMSRFADTEYWNAMSKTDFYYPTLESFINSRISTAINNSYFSNLGRLYIDLKRINKLRRRQWFVKAIIKLVVSKKKYKKLKQSPERFFEDSKSGFIRYLKKFYF